VPRARRVFAPPALRRDDDGHAAHEQQETEEEAGEDGADEVDGRATLQDAEHRHADRNDEGSSGDEPDDEPVATRAQHACAHEPGNAPPRGDDRTGHQRQLLPGRRVSRLRLVVRGAHAPSR
jgi:hypothetical protein